MNIKHRHFRQNIRTRYTALIVIKINKINNICIHRNNKLAKIECSLCETSYVENKSDGWVGIYIKLLYSKPLTHTYVTDVMLKNFANWWLKEHNLTIDIICTLFVYKFQHCMRL